MQILLREDGAEPEYFSPSNPILIFVAAARPSIFTFPRSLVRARRINFSKAFFVNKIYGKVFHVKYIVCKSLPMDFRNC